MSASRSPGGSKPLFQQIADDLLDMISSGQVGPGQQLPTENDLAERYATTRPTVRQALATLRDAGHIDNVPRRGWYVRSVADMTWWMSRRDSLRLIGNPVDPWTIAVREAGHVGTLGAVTVTTVTADKIILDERLGDVLDLRGEDLAVCRTQVRYINSIPSEVTASYAPHHLVGGGDFMHPGEEASPLDLVTRLGYTPTAFTDTARARMPTALEASRLELGQGSAVMELVRKTDFHPTGTCLLLAHSVFTGGGARFVWEVDAMAG